MVQIRSVKVGEHKKWFQMTPTCVQSCKNLSKQVKLEAMHLVLVFFFLFFFFYGWVLEYYIEGSLASPVGWNMPPSEKVWLARGLPEPTYKAGYTDGVLGRNSRCRPPSFWSPELTHAPAEGEAQPRQRGSFKAGSSSVLVGSYQLSYTKGHFTHEPRAMTL